MILTIYASLFIISFALLFLGYYSKTDSVKLVGFGIIFLLGVTLMDLNIPGLDTSGGIEYKNYTDTMYVYGHNFSGYHWDYVDPNTHTFENDAFIFHTLQEYDYAKYTNHTIGFLISICGFLGWVSIFLDYRKRG